MAMMSGLRFIVFRAVVVLLGVGIGLLAATGARRLDRLVQQRRQRGLAGVALVLDAALVQLSLQFDRRQLAVTIGVARLRCRGGRCAFELDADFIERGGQARRVAREDLIDNRSALFRQRSVVLAQARQLV